MDIGNFWFIGEEVEMIFLNVWLLFVMIEKFEEVLLLIFYWCIFVIVELLVFYEWLIFECIELVKYLFEWEVKWIKKNIVILNENFFVLII